MFYIYIAHFQTLMWQLFHTWVGPLGESPVLQHKDPLCLFFPKGWRPNQL